MSSHCATIHITCRTALINIKHESVAFVCLCGSMIGNKLIETKAIYKARTHGHALTDPRLSSDWCYHGNPCIYKQQAVTFVFYSNRQK